MTRDETHGVLQQHLEALNGHDIDALVALYADDAVVVSPLFETVRGRSDIRRSFERLFMIYPDYHVEIADSLFICEGDRAAEFSTATGTQSLEFFGLPPTGQRIAYQAARLFTFREGLITYEQRLYDFRGVLERLDKARMERELAMASAVQHSLVAGVDRRGVYFEVVGSSWSCRAIGGDFIECLDLPDGDIGVALGDVSGKGPAAALIATMVQGMFSVIAETSDGPGETLSRVNRALCRRGLGSRFATLAYGVLSPTGRFVHANAGHNPPILLTASGPRRLTAGGTVLGIFETADFPEETVWLGPGDTVITFSDGVTDAASASGKDFGADRLVSCACAHRSARPADLLESLLGAIRKFANGTPLGDDATIVITRCRTPEASPDVDWTLT